LARSVPASSSETTEADSGSEAAVDIVARHSGRGRLLHRTAWVSALTLVSRILGFVREILSAYLFGDRSGVYDAFITAWRVPNLFRRFLGEGALSTSLQRAITAEDGDRGEAAGAELFVRTLRLVAWILLGVCALSMLGVHFLPDRMPGTDFEWLGKDPGAVRDLTVRLMPFVVLVCVSALMGGALFVRGHFTTPNLAPAVLNLGWIATLVILGWRYGWSGEQDAARHLSMTHFLAWGVLAAGFLQLAIQVPALARHGLIARRERVARSAATTPWKILKSSAPLAFGAAVYQINVMLDGLMAESLLPDGGPTAHYYANRVQQFPLALVSIAATNAVFPALTALGHRRELPALRSLHDRTQRAVAFVALPASLGLLCLAPAIVSVCFEHGAFGAEGVARTTGALRALTLAILPAGAVGLVARTYYSLGDYKHPVRMSAIALGVNLGLNLVFLLGFGMDVEGLALATAISSWVHLVLLLPGLVRRLGLPPAGGDVRRGLGGLFLAAGAATAVAVGVEAALRPVAGPILALIGAIATGIATHWMIARRLDLPELRHLLDRSGRAGSRRE